MKRLLAFLLVGIFLLSGCESETGIEAHSAWMRPMAQGTNGAVYFELHNHSAIPDQLTVRSRRCRVSAYSTTSYPDVFHSQ